MKNLFLIFCIIHTIANAQAVRILSADAYISTDTNCNAYLSCKVRTAHSGCSRISETVNLSSDTIYILVCYESGFLTTTCTNTDTFCIGNLSEENYTVKLTTAISGIDPTALCGTSNKTDSVFFALNFDPLGLSSFSDDKLNIAILNDQSISLFSTESGLAIIQILDVLGRQYYNAQTEVTNGMNNVTLNMAKLASGVYLYCVQVGARKKVIKYMKQ